MSDQDNAPVQDNGDEEVVLQTPDELTQLKARADLMGLSYHPKIGVDTLRAKIAEAMAATGAPKVTAEHAEETAAMATFEGTVTLSPTPAPAADAPETEGQKRRRLKNEALKLVRIRLTCMNPAKKEWHGEIFTVGNAAIGTVKKFVPFNAGDDGYHVPNAIYKVLRDRQCQVFYTERSKAGINVRKGKMIKEFAIEVLPPLTPEELHELAQRQAMAKSVD